MTGLLISFVVFNRCFGFKTIHAKLFTMATTFGNSGTLASIFIAAICATQSLFTRLDPKLSEAENVKMAVSLGATYVSGCMGSFSLVYWTIGYMFFTFGAPNNKNKPQISKKKQDFEEKTEETQSNSINFEKVEEEAENFLNVEQEDDFVIGNGEEKEILNKNNRNYNNYDNSFEEIDLKQQHTESGEAFHTKDTQFTHLNQKQSSISSIFSKIRAIFHKIHQIYHFLQLDNIFTPQLASITLGITFGCIPFLKNLFFLEPPPGIDAFMRIVKITGDVFNTAGMMVLGGNILVALRKTFSQYSFKNIIQNIKNFGKKSKKYETKFSILQIPALILKFLSKIHKIFFPFTNLGTLLCVFLKQVFLPIVTMTIIVGYIVLGRGLNYYVLSNYIFEENEFLRIVKQVVQFFFKNFLPSDDPVLLFV